MQPSGGGATMLYTIWLRHILHTFLVNSGTLGKTLCLSRSQSKERELTH